MPDAPPAPFAPRTARRSGVTVVQALRSSTRAAILAQLRDQGDPRTVRDVAASFELHPNVARTHLELLADAGLVDVGRRKHPRGGRPAKLYTAVEGAPAGPQDAVDPGADPGSGPTGGVLLVRLLAGLVEDRPAPPFARAPSLAARAHELAGAEGRQLVAALADRQAVVAAAEEAPTAPGSGAPPRPDRLEVAARVALTALRPHAPEVDIAGRGPDWIDMVGVRGMFALLDGSKPALAEALERGLLAGALAEAGIGVSLADAGGMGRGHVLRARAVPATPSRRTPTPRRTVDARGQHVDAGVVHALRAVAVVRLGEVIEVLTEGPGSPAAFARWADRAGHQLLGVERVTDANGQPAIRLVIRKGA